METVTVTREQLYEQVWATPMSRLAAQYGVSGVALAKTCAKLDIPVPPRGYWARIAAGQKPKRPKLPPGRPNKAVHVTFNRVVVDPTAPVPLRPEPPEVKVPDTLTEPNPVVRALARELREASTDGYGRLLLGFSGNSHAALRRKCEKRALVLLDALFKALIARGHSVEFTSIYTDGSHPQPVAIVHGEKLPVVIEEKLARKPHALTAEEREQKEKWHWSNFPKYDYYPDEELVIRVGSAHWQYKGRQSWSDTKTQRLEDLLGHAVLGFEGVADFNRQAHEEAERERLEREEQERIRLRQQRLRDYQLWLATDLDRMASDWKRAQGLRDFLAAYEARLNDQARTECVTTWCDAVRRYVAKVDPLAGDLGRVAKELEPSDEVLAEFAAAQSKKARSAAA